MRFPFKIQKQDCDRAKRKRAKGRSCVFLHSADVSLAKTEKVQSEAKCSHKINCLASRELHTALATAPADLSSCRQPKREKSYCQSQMVAVFANTGVKKLASTGHNEHSFLCSCTETCQAKFFLEQTFSRDEMHIKITGSSVSESNVGGRTQLLLTCTKTEEEKP